MSGPKLQDIFDNVRIPIYQPSIFNAGVFRNGSDDVNRRYWNCFPVVQGNQAGAEVWIEKRQPIANVTAFDLAATLGAVNSNCHYNISISQLNDVCVAAVWDNTNSKFVIVQYRPIAGTQIKIGELVGAASTDEVFLSELNIAGTCTLGVVYHKNDYTNSKAYYATSAGGVFTVGSLTQIVDADFPTQIGTPDHLTGPMIQMNGITYVMGRSGAIYGSDDSSISSWNPLNKIQAIQYPDLGVGIVRYKHFIVAFGDDSTEFFLDVGNAPPNSRLQRTDQAFIKFGCVHPRSFFNIDDVLYWIGRSSSGTNGLWKLDGYAQKKLSGQDEDSILSIICESFTTGPHVARLWPVMFNARKHLMIGTTGIFGNGIGLITGQTFTGDPNSLTAGTDTLGGHLCMSIEGEEFWAFKAGFSTATQFFFPLMAVDFQLNRNQPNTLYFVGAYATTTNTTIGKNIFSIAGNLTNATLGNYDYASSTDFTGSMPTVGFQLNSIDFGNSRYKRISRLGIVLRGLKSNGTTAYLWFAWSKNDNTAGVAAGDALPSMVNIRSISLPNYTYRWSVTNLGIARSWTFAVLMKNIDAVAFKELEADVVQYTR